MQLSTHCPGQFATQLSDEAGRIVATVYHPYEGGYADVQHLEGPKKGNTSRYITKDHAIKATKRLWLNVGYDV